MLVKHESAEEIEVKDKGKSKFHFRDLGGTEL